MNSEQRSVARFCARCNVARACHATTGSACANFVERTSPEGRAILKHEAPTKVIDGDVLDRVLLQGAVEHLQARIRQAGGHLKNGMALKAIGNMDGADKSFERALKALGSLGAE